MPGNKAAGDSTSRGGVRPGDTALSTDISRAVDAPKAPEESVLVNSDSGWGVNSLSQFQQVAVEALG